MTHSPHQSEDRFGKTEASSAAATGTKHGTSNETMKTIRATTTMQPPWV
jgi:hypothetical protein